MVNDGSVKVPRFGVVTGATGFIGANLVRELIAAGWDVLALHRASSSLKRIEGLPIETGVCDILDRQAVERALPSGVDALFHLAADPRITDRRTNAQTRVNVEGTENVLAAALACGIKRFIHTSSMSSFGIHEARIDETTPSNALETPVNYFHSKYYSEQAVDRAVAQGLEAVIVNPSNVVGPFDTRNMPAIYIRLVRQRKIPVIGPGRASFCHAREVARAMISAVDNGRTGERYLLGGADASFFEAGRVIQAVVGGRAPRFVVPASIFRFSAGLFAAWMKARGRHTLMTPQMALALSSNMLVDSSKAERELGYRAVSLRAMIEDEAKWLGENGLLDKGIDWTWTRPG